MQKALRLLRTSPMQDPNIFTITGSTRRTVSSAPLATSPNGGSKSTIERPRRFAPLDSSRPNQYNAPELKGIVFDVDGTLCLPQNYMFREMRTALLIPKSMDILEHIHSLSEDPDGKPLTTLDADTGNKAGTTISSNSSPQSRAIFTIQEIERRAMTTQRPQPGLVELMTYLTDRGMPKALCTRNFPAPVYHLLETHLPPDQGNKFHPIITRETDGILPKPSPEGIWKIAEAWGLDQDVMSSKDIREAAESTDAPEGTEVPKKGQTDVLELAKQYLGSGLLMVGDSMDDMAAGYRAGAATVLLVNEENGELADHEYTDLSIKKLDDLIEILGNGFEGKA